jgi:hypothetical protein
MMIGLFRFFFFIPLLISCTHMSVKPDSMLGTWENVTNGDRVALVLKANHQCDLLVERAFKQPSSRRCQFEKFQERFLLFLVKEDGLCGSNADFEFVYEESAPLIHFIVSDSEILMNKQN